MINPRLRAIQFSLVLTCLLFAFQVAGAASFSGQVVGVSDGDTISVMHDGKAEKIRLNGIDCPESHQDFGRQAKHFTSDLAFNKTVTIEVSDHDKYGRTVGDVILPDGRNLNRELVRAGFAWWYKQYSKDQSLGELEVEARAAKRGLWQNPAPVAPWDFRHGKKTAATSTVTSPKHPSDLSERLLAPVARSDTGKDSTLSDRLTQTKNSPQVTKEKQPSQTETVFVTRTGRKYHRDGCRYLSKSRIPIGLADAKADGFTPCSVCVPPP